MNVNICNHLFPSVTTAEGPASHEARVHFLSRTEMRGGDHLEGNGLGVAGHHLAPPTRSNHFHSPGDNGHTPSHEQPRSTRAPNKC